MNWRTKVKPPGEVSATATLSLTMKCTVNWPLPPASAWPTVFYRLYRNGGLLADSISYTNGARLYVDRSVVGLTTYSYAVAVVNSRGTEGPQRTSTVVVTPEDVSSTWVAFSGPLFNYGSASNWSFDAYDPLIASPVITSIGTALPTGVTLDSTGKQLVYDGGGAIGSTTNHILRSLPSAEADWQARIAGAGVVWYHDFRADAEVTNFRVSNNNNGGWNDPAGRDGRSPYCRRITTDGVTGACMEILRPATPMSRIDGGTSLEAPHWVRQFSPLNAASTGRGVADPGASGTITTRSFTPTPNGNETRNWTGGWYANAGYHATDPGAFDGTEYWIQCRIKMDPRRLGNGNTEQTGKMLWVTRADSSATDQEVILESGGPGIVSGSNNYVGMYRSVTGGDIAIVPSGSGTRPYGNQPGTAYGTVGDGFCRFDNNGGRLANCWAWPNPEEWVTVLWHIRPGTASGLGAGINSGNSDTLVQMYVARAGVTSYTKIWDQSDVDLPFDVHWGHQTLYLSTYCNEAVGSLPNPFYVRFCQLIFSKQTIPCPQV